jgi:hypothetical protein
MCHDHKYKARTTLWAEGTNRNFEETLKTLQLMNLAQILRKQNPRVSGAQAATRKSVGSDTANVRQPGRVHVLRRGVADRDGHRLPAEEQRAQKVLTFGPGLRARGGGRRARHAKA